MPKYEKKTVRSRSQPASVLVVVVSDVVAVLLTVKGMSGMKETTVGIRAGLRWVIGLEEATA